MIAPYDPHGRFSAMVASRVDGRVGKIKKGMMIIPLDPSGFLAAVVAWSGDYFLVEFQRVAGWWRGWLEKMGSAFRKMACG